MTEDARQAHPRIPREFWEALITVHNHHFLHVLSVHRRTPHALRDAPLLEAFRFLDCLLDVAIEEGWLD